MRSGDDLKPSSDDFLDGVRLSSCSGDPLVLDDDDGGRVSSDFFVNTFVSYGLNASGLLSVCGIDGLVRDLSLIGVDVLLVGEDLVSDFLLFEEDEFLSLADDRSDLALGDVSAPI